MPDFAIARSRVRLPPVAAVYQRQLSVPSLRGRLMSTSESWGVNGHTTRCTSPVSVVLQLRLLSGTKRRSSPPYGPLRLGKGLYFYLLSAVKPVPLTLVSKKTIYLLTYLLTASALTTPLASRMRVSEYIFDYIRTVTPFMEYNVNTDRASEACLLPEDR